MTCESHAVMTCDAKLLVIFRELVSTQYSPQFEYPFVCTYFQTAPFQSEKRHTIQHHNLKERCLRAFLRKQRLMSY